MHPGHLQTHTLPPAFDSRNQPNSELAVEMPASTCTKQPPVHLLWPPFLRKKSAPATYSSTSAAMLMLLSSRAYSTAAWGCWQWRHERGRSQNTRTQLWGVAAAATKKAAEAAEQVPTHATAHLRRLRRRRSQARVAVAA